MTRWSGSLTKLLGDAMPTRFSTAGLAPAWPTLRAWRQLFERGVRGWRLAGVVAILGQACFQRLDALTQLLNQRSLLDNQHTQPVQLVGGVFRRTSRHVLSDLLLRYTGRLLLGKGS